MESKDLDVAHAMIRYGGSFVKALGEATLCADSTNLAKIKDTWPEYWTKYEEMSKLEMAKLARGGA